MIIYTIISSICFFISAIIGVRIIYNINFILDKLSTNSSIIRSKWIIVKRFSIFIVALFLLFTFLVFRGPNHYIVLYGSITFLIGTFLVHYIVINSKDTIEKLTKIEKYLLSTVDDLQITNQSLEEFAYVATHDLRSPVINLKNLFNFYDDSNKDIEGNIEIIGKVKKSIDVLDKTLGSLIEVIMMKNTNELIKEKINICALTSDIITSLNAEIENCGITININIPNDTTIFGHPSKVYSIISNLITNAIKYRSKTRQPVVSISAASNEEALTIKVSDNGIGINMAEHGDKIFGLFNRIQNDNRGKGIGLYNVRNQVESLGGEIKVESVLGVGSTFIIRFKRKN